MKKAQKKKLRELLKNLAEIPEIKDGKIKTVPKTQELYKTKKDKVNYSDFEPVYVNKIQFFTNCNKAGISAEKAIELWNDKYKRTQEILAGS